MRALTLHDENSTSRWHLFGGTTELENAAVAEILHQAEAAIAMRDAFHLVLAGGTTPRRIYDSLRHAATHWQAWHIYFGDERCLPADHAERNSRMAKDTWLDRVPIPPAHIHPIPAETGAAAAANTYARLLASIDQFDLVLLGLGEDGHTASLFPGHELGQTVTAPAVLAVYDAPKPPPERVSLSAHRLAQTRQLMFLVTGEGKAQAAQAWRSGAAIPAAQIHPANGADVYIEKNLLKQERQAAPRI